MAERSSYGSSDSGTVANLTQDLNRLEITEKPKTENGNETPQQNRDNNFASSREVQRSLNFDWPERKDGEWMEGHPWSCEKPTPQEPIKETVKQSKVYPVPHKWRQGKGTNQKVKLQQIYLDLPEFIYQMKGLSIRQELENVLNSKSLKTMKHTPHVLEILQKKVKRKKKDKRSQTKPTENNKFKAFSLPQPPPQLPGEHWFLDCEYMLSMHLPDESLQWFNDDQHRKRIRVINPEKKEKRWVFIPSFRRTQIALLEWPKDDIVTKESTIRILVVRPSEFKEYVSYCGHKFPIICLPHDEIGAGYPRYWIQKIALRLDVQSIWMIDDSVECFYEYHPELKPPEHQDGKDSQHNYKDYRRRKFGFVFERIENFVKEADGNEKPIAAMSPRRWNPQCRPKKPFSCAPPQGAVYLNLRALRKKNVYYRPELKTLEDMIFGYECEKKGLKVHRDNRILLQDHQWKNTGARSRSVISK